jgi:hypothetical protein
MSWEELRPLKGGHGNLNDVRIASGKFFVIRIGSAVATSLGWRRKDHVNLLLGKDDALGKLRIVKLADGYYRLQPVSKCGDALRVQRSRLPGMSDEVRRSQRVRHSIVDGVLELDLPPWASGQTEEERPAAPPPRLSPPRTAPAAAQTLRPPTPTAQATRTDAVDTDDAIIHAVSDFYHRSIKPSPVLLARAAGVQPHDIPAILSRLGKAARITVDANGARPRGKPPLGRVLA